MKVLRIFGIWLIFVFAVLIMLLGFEFVNKTVSKSGFSSGKVLLFELEEKVFSGEILGRKFSADFSPVFEFFPKLRFLRFFIPPVIRIGFIIIGAVF